MESILWTYVLVTRCICMLFVCPSYRTSWSWKTHGHYVTCFNVSVSALMFWRSKPEEAASETCCPLSVKWVVVKFCQCAAVNSYSLVFLWQTGTWSSISAINGLFWLPMSNFNFRADAISPHTTLGHTGLVCFGNLWSDGRVQFRGNVVKFCTFLRGVPEIKNTYKLNLREENQIYSTV